MPPGPSRRCTCGEIVTCAAAFAERARGLPVGVRFHHSCARCRRDFSISSAGGIVFSLLAGVLLGGLGALIVVHPPGAAVGAEASNRWFGWVLAAFGAGGWGMFIARLLARRRHPVRT